MSIENSRTSLREIEEGVYTQHSIPVKKEAMDLEMCRHVIHSFVKVSADSDNSVWTRSFSDQVCTAMVLASHRSYGPSKSNGLKSIATLV